MSKAKSTRTWIATFVALCLLFAQMATAAYACPQLNQKSAPLVDAEMVAMADCDAMPSSQMDKEQPSLCKAHCQVGQQAHDPKVGADVSTPALDALWSLAWVLTPLSEFVGRHVFISHPPDRPRGSAPIYLVNQVFRL